MDLMKLHPAPWRVVDDLDNSFFVLDAKGKVVPGLVKMIGPVSREVAKKIVLAINAEKAIMDVGIYPVRVHTGFSAWCMRPNGAMAPVYNACGVKGCTVPPVPSTGPFEAIEVAMKWLAENKKLKPDQAKQSESASAD